MRTLTIGMFHSLSEQTMLFLQACLVGAALGVVYDVFRILRLAVKTHKAVVAVQDVVYLMLFGVVVFQFCLAAGGEIRLFIVVGSGLGFIVYYFTVGQLVYAAASLIIRGVKWVLHWLYGVFIAPFVRLGGFLRKKLHKLGVKSKKNLKKAGETLKLDLKRTVKVVYNGLVKQPVGKGRKSAENGTRSARPKKAKRKARSPKSR